MSESKAQEQSGHECRTCPYPEPTSLPVHLASIILGRRRYSGGFVDYTRGPAYDCAEAGFWLQMVSARSTRFTKV